MRFIHSIVLKSSFHACNMPCRLTVGLSGLGRPHRTQQFSAPYGLRAWHKPSRYGIHAEMFAEHMRSLSNIARDLESTLSALDSGMCLTNSRFPEHRYRMDTGGIYYATRGVVGLALGLRSTPQTIAPTKRTTHQAQTVRHLL